MILDDIVRAKKLELERSKTQVPLARIQELIAAQPPALNFGKAIKKNRVALIAEVKKASPSKGVIKADFKPVEIATAYAAGGASAISVLTEADYFKGSLDYLSAIRRALPAMPLLRKDFIFDPYQVYEARAHGADAILLIVAILSPSDLKSLMGLAHSLKMECLVESHEGAELRIAVDSGAQVIGINNRNLLTFEVDLATTERLRPLAPANRTIVSESGIRNRHDVERLRACGVDAVLVGESLVSATDIAAGVSELI
jgi:indole-3-glycerol phosphate synthase